MSDDERFSHIAHDPRFSRVANKKSKVKIDARFAAMLTDKRFLLKQSVDKRGRALPSQSKDDIHRFYDLDKADLPFSVDRSRGENVIESSSSESSSDEFSVNESVEEIEHDWHLQNDIDEVSSTEEISSRLAICNLDWMRINSDDIYTIFNSLKPQNGSIFKVTIYFSDFGIKRLAEEDEKGPLELILNADSSDDLDDMAGEDESEKKRLARERMRQYEMRKLKYYYAIVECDSTSTAEYLYNKYDGIEVESSGSCFDMRFVPESETFEGRRILSSTTPTTALKKYEAPEFTGSALNQTHVQCSWDESDARRLRTTMSKCSAKPTEEYFQKYEALMASSSSEEESATTTRQKILLGDLSNSFEDKTMEVTFNPKENDLKSQSLTNENHATVFDKYLAKRRLRRQEKKRLKKQQSQNSSSDEDKDLNTRPKRKRKVVKKRDVAESDSDEEKVFELDKRFISVIETPEFAIDPTNPSFKSTPGMKLIVEQRRLHSEKVSSEAEEKRRRQKELSQKVIKENNNPKLADLIQSVKQKASLRKHKLKNDVKI